MMITKGLFKKPKNELEGMDRHSKMPHPSIPDEMYISCPSCKQMLLQNQLMNNKEVCPKCGLHMRIGARKRIFYITDSKSFVEYDKNMISKNPLEFPEYDNKLENAKIASGENDGVICGTCTIGGYNTAIFVMEPYFMMGSMGVVVGEKITRLFEKATKERLPVIGFTVSGGARMQEGILSLMQMAKTSGAVKRHSDDGGLYIVVLTDPTTGGVTASFAMEGDITLAEPKALIGFAGPRVIEETIRQKLPVGFQRAEFLLEKGFVDEVVDRTKQKQYLTRLLKMHNAPQHTENR